MSLTHQSTYSLFFSFFWLFSETFHPERWDNKRISMIVRDRDIDVNFKLKGITEI